MMHSLVRDISLAARRLRRTPGISCVIVITLALGVGANAALFSLLNAIALRPPPIADAHRLAAISLRSQHGNSPQLMFYPTFLQLRERQQSFDGLFAYSGGGALTTESNGVVSRTSFEGVTPEYFTVLGLRPELGRLMSFGDVPVSGEPALVVVLSYRYWQQQFGGDRGIIGRRMNIEGSSFSIIGVMARGFDGLQIDMGSDIFVPLTVIRRLGSDGAESKRPIRAHYAIGRLRKGVSLRQARAEVRTLWPSIQEATLPSELSAAERDDIRRHQVSVERLAGGFSSLRERYTSPLAVLLGLSGLLLVAGCVNLSGLLLAQATDRRHQLAICLALGATRGRLARQLFVEGMVLSVAGAALAVPLAWWMSRALVGAIWTASVPLLIAVTPDVRVLGMTAVVTAAVILLVGTLPAYAAGRTTPHLGMQSRSVTFNPNWWFRSLLVAQVAISVALVFGAGLLSRTFTTLRAIAPGTHTEDLLWTRVLPVPGGYLRFDETTYYPELVRQLSSLPGVQSVALSRMFPAYLSVPRSILQPVAPASLTDPSAGIGAIVGEALSPGFFETTGMSLLEGRDFTWQDNRNAPAVAILKLGAFCIRS